MAETGMKRSRLQRLCGALQRRTQPAALSLLALGVAAFLMLPLAGKRCYLDEKALLVGGALPTVRQSGALDACLATHQQLALGQPSSGPAALVAAVAAAAGPPALAFYQLNFTRGSPQCSTVHTVVRSPRGDGSEGYVLMLPLNSSSPRSAALAAAAGVALAGHLQRSAWLAKDAVLLFTDAACGAEDSAEAWLAAYDSGWDLFRFPRAGLLQQALVLEVAGPAAAGGGAAGGASMPGTSSAPGAAELAVHGSDGQLPNLDLYYLIKRNLDVHTGLTPVSLRASSIPLPTAAQRAFGALADAAAAAGVASAAGAARWAGEAATLAAFAGQLASGRPTGGHAAFLRRQVDAATLTLRLPGAAELPPSAAGASPAARQQLRLAAYSALAAAEMVLRTFNNLQERLHHSTALYALLSPDRFASVAAYLAPAACLLAATLAQLGVAAQAATAAGQAHWRSAWRRAAAAHAVAWAAGALARRPPSSLHGSGACWLLSSSMLGPIKQLAWAAAAGLAAAEGPPALLAALGRGDGIAGSPGATAAAPQAAVQAAAAADRHQVQRCVATVGLALAALQGAHLLMGRWVRCCAFLLAAVPLYACAAQQERSGAARLAARAAACGAAAAAAVLLHSGAAAWLVELVAPHLLLVACIVLP